MKEITKYIVFNESIGALTMVEDAKIERCVAKDQILAYLQSFEDDSVCAGKVYDMFKKEYTDITNVTYCDGEYYWDSTVIYYFEHYDVALDTEFLNKVRR